jgi:F-type H+-transporting ATPase subunit epsilon
MASTFKIEIVTPERKFFEGEVEMLIARGINGDFGILPNHTPFVSPLGIGRLILEKDGKERIAAVGEGYIEVNSDKTIIVADTALWPDEIDVERAKRAKDRAEKRLKGTHPDVDLMRAEVALRKANVRIMVAKKHHR